VTKKRNIGARICYATIVNEPILDTLQVYGGGFGNELPASEPDEHMEERQQHHISAGQYISLVCEYLETQENSLTVITRVCDVPTEI
jgi:hypothetical protein